MTTTTHDLVLLAEFDNADVLVPAINSLRSNGYNIRTTYTPFPMEDIPVAIGLKSRPIHRIVLVAGTLGAIGGFAMCWYANVIGYRWNIGGRPANSWPAWIPITFELLVLCAGLSAAFSMLYFNGLPRLHRPIFEIPVFVRASRDRFLLAVTWRPPANEQRLREILAPFAPLSISLIEDSAGATS